MHFIHVKELRDEDNPFESIITISAVQEIFYIKNLFQTRILKRRCVKVRIPAQDTKLIFHIILKQN